MNRVECLASTPLISIVRYDHEREAAHHCDDADETCSALAINFVAAGSFALGIGKNNWTMSAGSQFASRPGVVHRYRHSHGDANDVCLSTRYSDGLGHEENFAREGPLRSTNRLEFLKLRLPDVLRSRDNLAIESWGCDLLSAITPTGRSARLYRERQLRWYASRMEAARVLLDNEFAETLSLGSLARHVGMSTFHFARVFAELTGTPPHRYLLGVRLNHARELLLSGLSVTQSCYDSGFVNLSHFIRSFRRRFGYLPSTAKKKARK